MQKIDIDIAPFIDHSLLYPTATLEQLQQWCYEADRFNFAAVCVYPSLVRDTVELLRGKKPKVCTVIGFPSGATTSGVKFYESMEAVDNGAEELDVVINIGWLKEGKTDDVHREIAQICEETGKTVKAIIETNLLTDEEKKLAAEICMDAGVQYIKTCTGWCGAVTVEDVKLIKEITRDRIGIKAASGIHTLEQTLDLIMAGATRIGTSRGVQILLSHEQEPINKEE
jgi:deoxyribose-phosphate aldolase